MAPHRAGFVADVPVQGRVVSLELVESGAHGGRRDGKIGGPGAVLAQLRWNMDGDCRFRAHGEVAVSLPRKGCQGVHRHILVTVRGNVYSRAPRSRVVIFLRFDGPGAR